MRSRLSQLSLTGALCLAAACGGQKSKTTADKANGQLRINPSASSFSTESGPEVVCAHFTLQPYIPAADGTPQLAGTPVSFDSTSANANDGSSVTDQILGCIDDGSGNVNWGYIVTVDTFSACNDDGTLGALIPDASPTSTTINVPVHCEAGLDVSVPIQVSIAVSEQSTGGYIDISAGVNATDVQVGCKQADIGDTDHLLHFGESYISDDGSTATGLAAIDLGASPTQFGGTVGATPNIDTYFTGDVAPGAFSTLYQTFINPCDGTQEYADTDHAQCVSDTSGSPTGTQAVLADAFAEQPGVGFAAVSVVSGASSSLTIYSSMGASGPNTMSPSTVFPSINALTTTNIPATGGYLITGVFIDQTTPLQFLVAATAPDQTPVYATLSYTAGAWSLGSFYDVTATVISCNGLYAAPASCFTPSSACVPTDSSGRQATLLPHNILPIHLTTYSIFGSYYGPQNTQVTFSMTGEPALTIAIASGQTTNLLPFANKLLASTAYTATVSSHTADMNCYIGQPTGTVTASAAGAVVTAACAPATWKSATGGVYSTTALRSDGTIWTWGNNSDGVLGVGSGVFVGSTPMQIGTATNWQSISGGYLQTAAIKADGTLWTWGEPLGYPADIQYVPAQVGTDTHWAAVALGSDFGIALKTDGTLWQWNGLSAPAQVGTDTNWASISARSELAVGIKNDHTLWTWDCDTHLTGQVGNVTCTSTPEQLGTDTDWAQVSAGNDFILAVKQDGTLWSAGSDDNGQLGHGIADSSYYNDYALAQIGTDTDWASAGAGNETAGAVKTGGDLYTWGWNYEGQLGDGTTVDKAAPELIGHGYASFTPTPSDAFGGGVVSYGLKSDQSLWIWGSGPDGELGIATNSSHVPALLY